MMATKYAAHSISGDAHSYAGGQRIEFRCQRYAGSCMRMARTAAELFRIDRLITGEGALTPLMETASPFPTRGRAVAGAAARLSVGTRAFNIKALM